jgi:CRISPR-associated endonuclease Csn1
MKKILGLDLGTTSIGWAFINESENDKEVSNIVKSGVRVVSLTTDEQNNFKLGKTITTNASRTEKRGARRSLQRYKLRRKALQDELISSGIIKRDFVLPLIDKDPRKIWELRAKAARERIELDDFVRILFAINKKRGYKSNRKAKDEGDGLAVDGMKVAMELYDKQITPGQYVYNRLVEGKRFIPDFYPSDLQAEFSKIWETQKTFYQKEMTDDLLLSLAGSKKTDTGVKLRKAWALQGVKPTGTNDEKKLEAYGHRSRAVKEQVNLEELALVLSDINGQLGSTSGLLGQISDRSKILVIDKITVGEYLYNRVKQSPHNLLKKQVFYRQDYLDEFEAIWEKQSNFYPQLTNELKAELRDITIFYQRRLKSKKGELSICELEEYEVVKDGKTRVTGPKVAPKSSPLFQEFRLWQTLNDLKIKGKKGDIEYVIELEQKQMIADALKMNERMTESAILGILGEKSKDWFCNFKEIRGHSTIIAIHEAVVKMLNYAGHDIDLKGLDYEDALILLKDGLTKMGINSQIVDFGLKDKFLDQANFEAQDAFKFYHVLYSAEDGDKLKKTLEHKFNIPTEYCGLFANIVFEDDYGSLCTRALKKILPYLQAGHMYSEAAEHAGYNHSSSESKEQKDKRILLNELELLPRNSLRNPVVEKILNQMIHVVNGVSHAYGKPDEIRVEMARELNQTAKQREETTKAIGSATKEHERIKVLLKSEFGLGRVTRNDIIKYKLYLELADNGFKTLYKNIYIPKDELFSRKFDIEHIIPKALLFDDSFSNKTLELAEINLEKGKTTAIDYIETKMGDSGVTEFKERCMNLYNKGKIGRAKLNKLFKKQADIDPDFLARDLVNTAYIAKKAGALLRKFVYDVNTTNGQVTSKLRDDWEIVEVMKELNWEKYDKAGLTYFETGKGGEKLGRIKDWTKRNDHRHHAMDAIAVAFTRPQYVSLLSNLSGRNAGNEILNNIQNKFFYYKKGKLTAKMPMPNMREACKESLETIIVSHKAKNKVVTQNNNLSKIKGKTVDTPQKTLTPRGALHEETINSRIMVQSSIIEKVSGKFDLDKIAQVTKEKYRTALLERLAENGGDPKKAFTGSNSLAKKPIILNKETGETLPEELKLQKIEEKFLKRKPVNPELNVATVHDDKVRKILEDRIAEYGNAKDAFSNLDENPIWMNKEKGIQIKSVRIKGISNGQALRSKKDHLGNIILKDGKTIANDWVNTGNNHHVAIYEDANGNLIEDVVSFYEATERANQNQPIIDTNKEGLTFKFTMKQNEIFVLPNKETGFDPNNIDLMDKKNCLSVIKNAFRVQKISRKNYMFTHIYETMAITSEDLKNLKMLKRIKYLHIQSTKELYGIVKVRINHLGQIVRIGEG